MVNLRYEIMRKPLGLSFNEEELKKEKEDILIGAFDEEEIIGCCMITKIDHQCGRLIGWHDARRNELLHTGDHRRGQ